MSVSAELAFKHAKQTNDGESAKEPSLQPPNSATTKTTTVMAASMKDAAAKMETLGLVVKTISLESAKPGHNNVNRRHGALAPTPSRHKQKSVMIKTTTVTDKSTKKTLAVEAYVSSHNKKERVHKVYVFALKAHSYANNKRSPKPNNVTGRTTIVTARSMKISPDLVEHARQVNKVSVVMGSSHAKMVSQRANNKPKPHRNYATEKTMIATAKSTT
tara:strand:- start:19040 stop:19690 length:651 start_codon:yes stop_codon:yes gene_type:complete